MIDAIGDGIGLDMSRPTDECQNPDGAMALWMFFASGRGHRRARPGVHVNTFVTRGKALVLVERSFKGSRLGGGRRGIPYSSLTTRSPVST